MADIRAPFRIGAEEVRIRVSRYDDDGNPACYQVWIDHRDRNVSRCVGILANVEAAFSRALEVFERGVNAPDEDDDVEDLLS